MSRTALFVAAMVLGASALYPVVQACGDKLLMVGRGTRFRQAYASIYPGNVYIYARPSADAKAAIRDTQLHKALRQAGHTVSVIEDWALLQQALKSVPVDIVLVDVAEAQRLHPLIVESPSHPEALYVAFPSTASQAPPAQVCKLKSSDRPLRYLEVVESAMKTRTQRKGS
jgi:hypothetical protein